MSSALLLILIVALQAPAQAERTGTGTLAVQVAPKAVVYVDGKLLSTELGEHRIDLPTGPHRVRIIHPDYLDLRRTIDIEAGQLRKLDVSLTEHGVRKPAASPTRTRTAARRGQSTATDPDLVKSIGFIAEGDFVPAIETLEAAVRNLANVPRLIREHALGYLYLGVAHAGLDQLDAARKSLARAQQIDASVAPQGNEFPAQILRLWEEARTVQVDEPEIAKPSAPVEPSEPVDAPEAIAPHEGGGTAAPAVAETEFIAEVDTGLEFRFVQKGAAPCAGLLAIERESRIVSWQPADVDCSAAFQAPFAELRSPAAGPQGGVLLQFRSDRPSMTLVPAPDADLLDPQVEPMPLNELPASTRVNLRHAIRRLNVALGRPASDTILGLQVDLPLDELLANSADFESASVRTRGVLSVVSRGRYLLTAEGANVQLLPSAGVVQLMASKASEWRGLELQVSGMFARSLAKATDRRSDGGPPFVISVASIEPAVAMAHVGSARQTTIQALTTTPLDGGELVRVIGRYRGKNWFGDLPSDSRRGYEDWVVKDGLFALWVTGRRPEGEGFALGASTQRDTQAWLAVTGTIEERKGIIYLKARRVELSPAPDSSAQTTPLFKSGKTPVPPQIAFLAPVAGIEPASPDQQFLLRFTKPMDESTFRDRVQVRYADAPEVNLPRTSVTYYAERMFSIMVDPGQALQPGRTIEVVLLPGIKDVDGLLLSSAEEAQVLKWIVAGGP